MRSKEIYFDELGMVTVDNGDSGDSAHFTALHIMATKLNPARAPRFMVKPGLLCRHPSPRQPDGWDVVPPWSNVWNCTRDQMAPVVGVLAAHGYTRECRAIFWQTAKRLFFAQNIERDAPGTTKFPWPHYAHRMMDNPRTKAPAFQGWPKALASIARPVLRTLGIVKQETGGDWVWFDFVDPMFPHYILCMVSGGWPRLRGIARALAFPFFVLDALTYRWSDNDDAGAIIGSAYGLGFVPWYKKIVPNWEQKCDAYFYPRGLGGLGEDVKDWLRREP